jgi:Protein of unknown function VcgC/VcgE (DUF2780)/Protein of unknown function (DUF3011)
MEKKILSLGVTALLVAFVATSASLAQPQTIVCSSDDMNRHSCPADTRGGVQLSRQISGSPCTQNSTWGFDKNSIWVDKGCRAEFQLLPAATMTATRTAVGSILSKASPDLIGRLTNELSITPAQASGGAGALFGLAKTRLSAADFSKVAAVVPGMDGLLKAAPAGSGFAGLSSLQDSFGSLSGMASVAGSFQKLGLSADMIGKFVPVLVNYVQSRGGVSTSALLTKALQ